MPLDHIRKEAGAVILRVTYGYTANPHGPDPLVDLAGRAIQTYTEAAVPGKWVVDTMPFVKYIPEGWPGAGWKSIGRGMRETLQQCVEQPYAFVLKQVREKRHKTSFLSQAIENIGADDEMAFIHKWSACSMYAAGADTVSYLYLVM